MDFGNITYDGMIDSDFQFPNVKEIVLPGHRIVDAKINIGFEKWGRTEWLGSFYKGLEHCYFFIHLYSRPTAPDLSKYVKEQFNEIIK